MSVNRKCMLAVALAATLASPPSHAQSADAPFAGETLILIVPSAPGGGFDSYSRIIAKHMPRHIPGTPTLILQYMPGGGGLKAANYLYTVAPKNGAVFGMLQETIPHYQILKEGAKYDAGKFSYIGRLSASNRVIIVEKKAPVSDLKGAMSKEVIIGATGVASWTYSTAVLVQKLTGANFRMVLGYSNTAAIDLAMERGELHGRVVNWETYWVPHRARFESGQLIPIIEVGVVRTQGMPGNVPLLGDLAKNSEDRELIEFLAADTAIGRAYAAPPGVPPDRLAILRTGFATTMKDADYLKDAATRGMTTDAATGEEIQKIAARIVSTPPHIVARAKTLLGWQ